MTSSRATIWGSSNCNEADGVRRVPTVLSAAEVARVIDAVPRRHNYRLLVKLLYGTGLRVSEGRTLRVRDIDLQRTQIIARAGKGTRTGPEGR